jgi:hypothetical protein
VTKSTHLTSLVVLSCAAIIFACTGFIPGAGPYVETARTMLACIGCGFLFMGMAIVLLGLMLDDREE